MRIDGSGLRGRLTLGIVSVLAVVLAVGGVLVAGSFESAERDDLDDRLVRTAELSDTAALAAVEQALPEVDDRLDAVLRATGSSLRVTVGETVVLQAGLPLMLGEPADLGFSTRTAGGEEVRVFAKDLEDEELGGLARVEVASLLAPLEERADDRRTQLVATGAIMLLIAGIGTWFAADVVLRPLRRLREATHDIASDEDLDRRLPVEGPAELRSLAGSFNATLVRLARSAGERNRALEATRRFAADAGHELRTPLTSVQATLSIIARHPELDAEQRAQLAADALDEQRRLVELLDGLQALARGDAAPVEHDRVDLADVVGSAAEAMRRRHPGVALETVLPDGPVTVDGWEAGLRLVAENLAGNAARHGRPGGRIVMTVEDGDGTAGASLVVDDDGPGIPEGERDRVLAPFQRLEGTDRPGSGLGLALVAQQAGHHGAALELGASPLGGTRVALRFPPR